MVSKSNFRTDNYSVLKTITACLVVIAHATRMYKGNGAIPMPVYAPLALLTDVIYSFHMPLFIFLSGVVYCKCIKAGKYSSYLQFIFNKFKRLMIPYMFFGVCFVAPVMCLLKITESSYFSYLVNGILLGLNSRHLWFLPVLFAAFALTGIFRSVLCKNNRFSLVLFAVALIFSFFSEAFPRIFCISDFIKYYCYFLGGVAVADCSSVEKKLLDSKALLTVFSLMFVLLTVVKYKLCSNIYVDRLIAFSGISACISWSSILTPPISKMKIYQYIQPETMGIYLFHPLIIYLLFYAIKGLNLNPILVSALIILLSFTLSYLLTRAVKKLKCGFLLGE